MFQRTRFMLQLRQQLQVHPACGLLGPRQSGKTTLAHEYAKTYPNTIHHFDLENPEDLLSLSEPLRVLERLEGLVIIDEIQRLPEIFPILRVLIDHQQAQYLILGSASRDLIRQSSETLAGRIGYIELTPFQLVEGCDAKKLLNRGGFPRSYLSESDQNSYTWRESYIQTFLERDIPNLGFTIPPLTLRRFWMMLAHVHGQLLNMSVLATSLGISGHTVRQYLDILAGTFMLRIMLPWHENIHKRQVKTPKIYFRDSGLLQTLLSIRSEEDLLRHPSLGAIWEGFALEQIIQALNIRTEEAFFWRTVGGTELDLFAIHAGQRLGFEFKFADAPRLTKSMYLALEDLRLDHLWVIYPGKREIPLGDKITAIGLENYVQKFSS